MSLSGADIDYFMEKAEEKVKNDKESCLDKQKVKEAIENILTHSTSGDGEHFEWCDKCKLLKELGL